jgi:hypothetical protein
MPRAASRQRKQRQHLNLQAAWLEQLRREVAGTIRRAAPPAAGSGTPEDKQRIAAAAEAAVARNPCGHLIGPIQNVWFDQGATKIEFGSPGACALIVDANGVIVAAPMWPKADEQRQALPPDLLLRQRSPGTATQSATTSCNRRKAVAAPSALRTEADLKQLVEAMSDSCSPEDAAAALARCLPDAAVSAKRFKNGDRVVRITFPWGVRDYWFKANGRGGITDPNRSRRRHTRPVRRRPPVCSTERVRVPRSRPRERRSFHRRSSPSRAGRTDDSGSDDPAPGEARQSTDLGLRS